MTRETFSSSFLIFLLLSVQAVHSDSQIFGRAVLEGLTFFDDKFGKTIDIVKLHKNNPEIDVMVSMITSNTSRFKFSIENFSRIEGQTKITGNKHFLIVNSKAAFNRFRSEFNPEVYPFKVFFLIVIFGEQSWNISELFGFFWNFNIFNVGVMMSEFEGSIDFLTFSPLSENSCNDLTPIVVNTFSARHQRWSTPFVFPKKFSNFYKCPVKVFCSNVNGFEFEVFLEVSKELNFVVEVTNQPNANVGLLFENGTAFGALNDLLTGKIDVMVRFLSIDAARRKFLSFFNSFHEEWLIFVVPSPPEMSSLAKLLYPFQYLAWAALVTFAVTTYCIIFFLNHAPKQYYDFVIGQSIQTPYLNTVAAFTGTPQYSLPSGTFARYLLAIFLIFCLVVRTMYVGKMFSIMNVDVKSAELATIEEFYDNGYNFYLHDGAAPKFKNIKYFKP